MTTTTAIDRVTPGAYTSGIFKLRGQKSRWRYPDPRVGPEDCIKLENVDLSRRGTVRSRRGWTKYNSTVLAGSEQAVGLWRGEFSSGATKTVVVTPTAVYSDNGTTRVTITGTALTGTTADKAHFAYAQGKLLFTNGVDQVRTWDGDDSTPHNTAALTGMPWTKAKDIMIHKNLLFAMGLTEGGTYYPTRIRWCDINRTTFAIDITNWPTANRYEVYDGGAAILAGVDCWGKAMIVKEDGLYPGEITYGPLGYYSFSLGAPRRGFTPLGRDAVVARPEFLCIAAQEGLMVFDPGLEMRLVNSDDYQAWLELNQDRLQYAQLYVRESEHQVRLLCAGGTCTTGYDTAVVWDWQSGALWMDKFAQKVNCGTSIFDSGTEYDLFGGTDSYLYKGNVSGATKDDDEQIAWTINTHPNDLGLPGRQKHVLNVRTLYRYRSGAGTATLRVLVDEGRDNPIVDPFSMGSGLKWNSGVTWNSGLVWPGGGIRYHDTYVNRICETVSLALSGDTPASIEGYQVEYVILEE